jgi:multidrug resistance efflux pump
LACCSTSCVGCNREQDREEDLPVLLTSAAVIVALLVLRQLWVYYMDEPWTRDAHVGADVVQVAPDVSGLVETCRWPTTRR